jgi:hypothetical protein
MLGSGPVSADLRPHVFRAVKLPEADFGDYVVGVRLKT